MRTPSTNCRLGLIVAGALVLSGCQPPSGDDRPAIDSAWPGGLVTPIEGATFSLNEEHLPASHQGFFFINGSSGRPLAHNEPVAAIADGEIIRIDHDYEQPEQARQVYYSQLANEPGFVGEFALDQLGGRQVWIRHEEGHVSRYAHLSEVHPELQPGDAVEQSEVIGLIGNTGLVADNGEAGPAPRLGFSLWPPEAGSQLGQDRTTLETHQLIAKLFGESALPRYARAVIAQVAAGNPAPDPYPPHPLPDTGFDVDPPVTVPAGNAFAVPVTWDADDFRASDFYAALEDVPFGILDVEDQPGAAWLLGVMPLDAEGKELVLAVGAVDAYGQSLVGSTPIQSGPPEESTTPREVTPAEYERHSEENRQAENQAIADAVFRSLQMTLPLWNQPFQPPLEGQMVKPFGERIYHGVLRPGHPQPGMEIRPNDPGSEVMASNDGMVAITQDLPIRGRTVAVVHGSGVLSLYAGLEAIDVEVGDSVTQGQVLGKMPRDDGDNLSTLRWEMHIGGVPSNPRLWIGQVIPGR